MKNKSHTKLTTIKDLQQSFPQVSQGKNGDMTEIYRLSLLRPHIFTLVDRVS